MFRRRCAYPCDAVHVTAQLWACGSPPTPEAMAMQADRQFWRGTRTMGLYPRDTQGQLECGQTFIDDVTKDTQKESL